MLELPNIVMSSSIMFPAGIFDDLQGLSRPYNMPNPLLARHLRPTLRIGGARIGATGNGLHASERPPSRDVAHVEPKHLLHNVNRFAERSSDSTQTLFKMKNQGSRSRSDKIRQLHHSKATIPLTALSHTWGSYESAWFGCSNCASGLCMWCASTRSEYSVVGTQFWRRTAFCRRVSLRLA